MRVALVTIISCLICCTLGSPVGVKLEESDVPVTTVVPDVVNDEAASTVRLSDENIIQDAARQEGGPPSGAPDGEEEEEEEDATARPAAPVTTPAPVPKPQYNESTIQSELNFVSQFDLGPQNETLPIQEIPAPPPISGGPIPPVGGNSSPAPEAVSPVESRANSTIVDAPVEAAPVAPVASSVAPATDEDEDEDAEESEDVTEAAAPQVRQPQEDANIPVQPVALAPAVEAKPAAPQISGKAPAVQQVAASQLAQAGVPQPPAAAAPQPQSVQQQPQEVDGDNDEDEDSDSENEIAQQDQQQAVEAVVGTTGAPVDTFEKEFQIVSQHINDNQGRRQAIENDESEEGNSTVSPVNNEATFQSEYKHTSQFLSDGIARADCDCGKVPYSVPLGGSSGINEYPWTVAIVRGGIFGGGRPHCAGTLINDKYVLTASHCMDGLYPSDIQVWLTVHSTFDSASSFGTQKVNVQEILMHPNYNRHTNENDVALIKVSQPIDISKKNYFVPVCIPVGRIDYAGTTARTTAWSDGRRNQICKADMPVLSNPVCSRDTKHQGKITDNMMCAGFLTPGTSIVKEEANCIPDAGGPLLSPNGGNWLLIGVASWGYNKAKDYSPTVYSRVTEYTDWIQHNTRDADWCGS